MASENLVKYIQDTSKKGFSREQIILKLKESGYTAKQIDPAMKAAFSSTDKKGIPAANKKKIPLWLFLIPLFLVLIFILIVLSPPIISTLPLGEYKPFTIIDATGCAGMTSAEEYLYCAMNQSPRFEIKTQLDCGLINDAEIVLLCQAILSGSEEDCQKASNQDYCYSVQVRNRADGLRCYAIENKVYRGNCLNAYNRDERISQYGGYLLLFRP